MTDPQSMVARLREAIWQVEMTGERIDEAKALLLNWEAYLPALLDQNERYKELCARALVYLPSTLGVTKDIRDALNQEEIGHAR